MNGTVVGPANYRPKAKAWDPPEGWSLFSLANWAGFTVGLFQ